MKFSWDENKRSINRSKHGIDFIDVKTVFDGYTFTFEDTRFNYGEERFVTSGLLNGCVVVIVHTEDEKSIRIISARKATRNEQKMYYQGITSRI
jgi:uncharacterized DUF497 family protein